MPEQKSPILRLSQKELTKLFESGDAKIVKTPEYSIDDLMENEATNWVFFTRKLLIFEAPPKEFFDVVQRAEKLGLTSFELHYLPEMTFSETDTYPGWNAKPDSYFWGNVRQGVIEEESLKLHKGWILIDTTERPNKLDNNAQMYANDPLKNLIIKLEKEGKIHSSGGFPEGSRFGLSWDQLYEHVFPELADMLEIPRDRVRLPKFIENNVLGNMFHPEWGEKTTGIWLNDVIDRKSTVPGRLVGNKSVDGSLTGLAYTSWNTPKIESTNCGFNPMIVFPFDDAQGKPIK